MGVLCKPDMAYENISAIDIKQLSDQGIRLVFSDLDNTLTEWNNPQIPAQARAFAVRLKAHHMDLVIVSNNKEPRIKPFAQALGVNYIAKAGKPLPFAILRYIKKHNAVPQKSVMVGDQLITDMVAGNCAGVQTILVRPIDTSHEYTGTRINRMLEKLIFRFMRVDWK